MRRRSRRCASRRSRDRRARRPGRRPAAARRARAAGSRPPPPAHPARATAPRLGGASPRRTDRRPEPPATGRWRPALGSAPRSSRISAARRCARVRSSALMSSRTAVRTTGWMNSIGFSWRRRSARLVRWPRVSAARRFGPGERGGEREIRLVAENRCCRSRPAASASRRARRVATPRATACGPSSSTRGASSRGWCRPFPPERVQQCSQIERVPARSRLQRCTEGGVGLDP